MNEGIDETDAQSPVDDTPEAIVEPLQVFISYRTNPDAPLAVALKKLIETAIEPQPRVFVSGEGGLRPSNVGFKQQIQAAAQASRAFIGLITNASRDREWIFFEAGAAWGQGKMYAPVMIGTKPDDLPSTIGDYQAIQGRVKEDMLKLIEELAVLGGCVVDRFGKRFQYYAKAIDQYLTGGLVDAAQESNEGLELRQAAKLAAEGQLDLANAKFDELEAAAGDDLERLCDIRMVKLRATTRPSERSKMYARFADNLKNTTTYHYSLWLGRVDEIRGVCSQ